MAARIEALEPAGVRTTSEFAEQLLLHAHVALTAGEGFDAPGYFRISLTANDAMIEQALPGFATALQKATLAR